MKTIPKTFDAVASSRQWREETGRRLDAMSVEERLAFLEGMRVRGATTTETSPSCVVREETPPYGNQRGKAPTP